jgi:hypothetical protein
MCKGWASGMHCGTCWRLACALCTDTAGATATTSAHRRHNRILLSCCTTHPTTCGQSPQHQHCQNWVALCWLCVCTDLETASWLVATNTQLQFACHTDHFGVEVVCRGGETRRAAVRLWYTLHAGAYRPAPTRTYVLTAFAHVPPLLVALRLDDCHITATHPAEFALQLGPDHLLLGELGACAGTLLPA